MSKNSPEFDYVISFVSVGAGIEQATYDSLGAYLESLTDKVTVQHALWGMEGEVDYCINVNERSESERKKIHEKLMEILGDSKLTTVKFNATCSHLTQGN